MHSTQLGAHSLGYIQVIEEKIYRFLIPYQLCSREKKEKRKNIKIKISLRES
jgi:hypothetical protein